LTIIAILEESKVDVFIAEKQSVKINAHLTLHSSVLIGKTDT